MVQLYAGAFFPGLMLAGMYMIYVVIRVMINPALAPALPKSERDVPFVTIVRELMTSFVPLSLLIFSVLGAIMFGLATPSEAAAIGALGALVLAAAYRSLTFEKLKESVFLTARTSAILTSPAAASSGALRRSRGRNARAGCCRDWCR